MTSCAMARIAAIVGLGASGALNNVRIVFEKLSYQRSVSRTVSTILAAGNLSASSAQNWAEGQSTDER